MFNNEIKWSKHLKSLKNDQKPQKLVECIKNLLKEAEKHQQNDEILWKIDNLLLEMTKDEQKLAQKLINEIVGFKNIKISEKVEKQNNLLLDMIDEFYPYAQKQLGFKHPAEIILKNDEENAANPLGKTAFYDPNSMTVYVYVSQRHPKDILRSISHELVHHMQNCQGKLGGEHETNEGYAQTDPHLREMEREAYEKGNLVFRDFEDNLKKGIK